MLPRGFRATMANTSIQAAMRPLDKIKWASPFRARFQRSGRMQAEDINQMPVLKTAGLSG